MSDDPSTDAVDENATAEEHANSGENVNADEHAATPPENATADESRPAATTAAEGDLAIREPPRVLVPLKVLEGETIAADLVTFLAPAEIVVLGYHVLPEQTPLEQASMNFEDRARDAVEDVAETFRKEGRTVETRVAFTHDEDKTLDRIAREVSATAVLLPNPSGAVEEVLVPLRGAVDVGRLVDLVGTLVGPTTSRVHLWSLTGDEGADDDLETARATLADRGVDADRITTERTESATPTRDIVDRSDAFDVVVMGEGKESLLTTVLGDSSERIAEGAVAPVLVVRRRAVEDDEASEARDVTDEPGEMASEDS